MVAFRRVLRRPILGGFEKIHFQGLDYGEVEPNFVEEFEDELNYEWEIIKANVGKGYVKINRSSQFGTTTMKRWYSVFIFYVISDSDGKSASSKIVEEHFFVAIEAVNIS
ncbi:hypothetical protein QL285_015316 [Trifolium repens]|nr:hypothetical protein QL285_015316 [Trifolium repens]